MSRLKRNNLNHPVILQILIIMIFALISWLSLIFLLHTHHLLLTMNSFDSIFHYHRIIEIKRAIQNHYIPFYSTDTFIPTGGAVMAFYPYLTLIPAAILSFFVKSPVNLIYIFYISVMFLRLIISFYSCKSNSKSYLTSLVFAILYSVSGIYFDLALSSFDFGACIATIFIPMVLFGWLEWQRNGHWSMLSIGMILIIFSHVITSLIIIFTLVILLILNGSHVFMTRKSILDEYSHFNFVKFINLIKAATLVILTSAVFWVPALHLSFLNKIMRPGEVSKNLRDMQGSGIFVGILHVPNWSFGLIDLIGLVSLIWFYKLSRTQKELLVISLCYWGFNSAWLPWNFLKRTPLDILQFPSRLMVIGHFGFAYLLAYSLTGIIFNHRHLIGCVILVGIALLSEGLNENQMIKINSSLGTVSSTVTNNHDLIKEIGHRSSNPIIQTPAMTVNNVDVKHLHNLSNVIEPDYWPRPAYKLGYRMIVAKFSVLTNNKNEELVNCKLHNGKLYFKNSYHDKNMLLPAFVYHGQSYKAYLDGKRVPVRQHRQLMMIHDVKPSRHTFKLKPQVTKLELNSQRLTILGVIIYLLLFIFRIIKYFRVSTRLASWR